MGKVSRQCTNRQKGIKPDRKTLKYFVQIKDLILRILNFIKGKQLKIFPYFAVVTIFLHLEDIQKQIFYYSDNICRSSCLSCL